MKQMLLVCGVGVLSVISFAQPAASHAQQSTPAFSGTWEIAVSLMGSPMPETCSMHTEGKSLKGSCKMEAGVADIVGELDGSDISFRHAGDVAGNAVAFTFKGKVASDESFAGTMGIDEFGVTSDFTAKKVGPEKKS